MARGSGRLWWSKWWSGSGAWWFANVQFLPISRLFRHNMKERMPKSICPWWDRPWLFEALDDVECRGASSARSNTIVVVSFNVGGLSKHDSSGIIFCVATFVACKWHLTSVEYGVLIALRVINHFWIK